MLVTSSQISVAISSGIVCVFTTLLFLSGYVLQQQTVRSLQAAIHPKPPSAPVPTLNPVLAKHFGRPPGHSFYDKYLASNRPKGGWAKVAYVQLLRSHMHVCNAVMLFAILEEQDSMAQRVLMYPRDWDDSSKKDDPIIRTSRRLLRDAASRYKVMLQPIAPIAPPPLPEILPRSTKDQEEPPRSYSDEESYPLVNLLTLTTFNRVLYLQPSGIILDATPLDRLFTLPMTEDQKPILGLTSPIQSLADRPAMLLFEPSQKNYEDTVAALPEGAYPDLDFLALVHAIAAPSSSTSSSPSSPSTDYPLSSMLLAESSSLHHIPSPSSFNSTAFLEATGYVHFQDEGVKGPEYELSGAFRDAAPRGDEERRAWEGAYERFREGRMGVCGLDLEVVVVEEDMHGGEGEEEHEVGEKEKGREELLEEGWVEVAVEESGSNEFPDDGIPKELLPDEGKDDLK